MSPPQKRHAQQHRNPRKKYIDVPQLPYFARGPLLSQGEIVFARTLSAALPPGVVLFAKVRLADLVTCGPDDWSEWGWKIGSKHVDFVLVDADSTRILLVVELDDKSHDRRDRKGRDEFVDAALGAAGLSIVRWKAAAGYERAVLAKAVQAALVAVVSSDK